MASAPHLEEETLRGGKAREEGKEGGRERGERMETEA
jgi:hypothetical protein